MAGLALGVVGGVVGGLVGGPIGSQVGYALGSMAGNYLFAPTQKQEGPRLNSFNIQTSTNGIPINKGWGTFRTAGNIIWFGGFKEIKKVETQRAGGGKGGPKVESTTYSYNSSFALGIHDSEISGIRRIWANKKLVYNVANNNTGLTTNIAPYMRIYLGTETQEPDSLIQQKQGDYTPAFRGVAYVVFENLPLGDFNNQLPQLEFEIVRKNGNINNDKLYPREIGSDHYEWFNDQSPEVSQIQSIVEHPVTKYLYTINAGFGEAVISKVNPKNMTIINSAYYTDWLGGYVGTNTDGDLVFSYGGTVNQDLTFNIVDKDTLITKKVEAYVNGVPKPAFAQVCSFTFEQIYGANYSSEKMYSFTQAGMIAYDVNENEFIGTIYPTTNPDQALASAINNNNSKIYYLTHEPTINGTSIWLNKVQKDGVIYTNRFLQITSDDIYDQSYLFVNPNLSVAYVVFCNSFMRDIVYVKEINLTNDTITAIKSFTFNLEVALNNDLNFAYSLDKNRLYFTIRDSSNEFKYICVINLNNLEERFIKIDNTEFADYWQIDEYQAVYSSSWDGYIVPTIKTEFGSPTFGSLEVLLFAENRFNQEDYMLGDLIRDVCLEAGISEGLLDTTEIDLIPVRGFKRDKQMTVRQIFETLAVFYNFDAVESNGILKFIVRGKEPVATITEGELGAGFYSDSPSSQVRFQTYRTQESELPKTLNVVYYDAGRNYEMNTQQAQRVINTSNNIDTVEAPIVFTAQEAKKIAERLIYQAYVRRDKYQFETNYDYIDIEPTDVVVVQRQGQEYFVRITNKDESQGIIKFQGEAEQVTVYDQSDDGIESGSEYLDDVFDPAQTFAFILDIPIFDLKDNDGGNYAVVDNSIDGTWRGADIFKSSERDGDYYSQTTFTQKTKTGKVIAFQNSNHQLNTIDYLTRIEVSCSGQLYSITREDLLNGGNLCLIGNELLQFMNAELTAPNTYVLTGLLRGRFGTEKYISQLAINKQFIFFDFTNSSIARINKSDYMYGVYKYYKGVSVGQSLDEVASIKFRNNAIGLKPYSVVHVVPNRNDDGDLVVEFNKRMRGQAVLNNTLDPLDPDGDYYEMDIYKNGAVVRTLTSTTLSFTYPASQQITDFGSVQSSVNLSIYKVNRSFGRGFDYTNTL